MYNLILLNIMIIIFNMNKETEIVSMKIALDNALQKINTLTTQINDLSNKNKQLELEIINIKQVLTLFNTNQKAINNRIHK